MNGFILCLKKIVTFKNHFSKIENLLSFFIIFGFHENFYEIKKAYVYNVHSISSQ